MRRATVYPENAIEQDLENSDVINPRLFDSISGVFEERVRRSANKTAYIQYEPKAEQWLEYSWSTMLKMRNQWQQGFLSLNLSVGDRVAIRAENSVSWILFDQSALSLGLVVVPIYVEDRADNIAYILNDTETRLLCVDNYEQWLEMSGEMDSLGALKKVVVIESDKRIGDAVDERVISLAAWLRQSGLEKPCPPAAGLNDLATVVYTSGTTGKPKGVMLSHGNMMLNAYGGLQSILVYPDDRFLSFLPLSHMFERTVGYYLTMMSGAEVAFNRSVPELLEDLAEIKPTGLITVPRIFERAYANIRARLDEGPKIKAYLFDRAVAAGWQKFEISQGRRKWSVRQLFRPVLDILVARKVAARFGGRLRLVISGGARLSPKIAEVFIGLGINVFQGYGLTECSPVLTVNTRSRNKPSSIGLPFAGAEIRLGENDELQARGPYIMSGYWRNPEATKDIITADGWLMTGDIASIDEEGYISITGRIKEIIVLSNGEKVPLADVESAISGDPLFEQVMVIGEGRPYFTAVIVLNKSRWIKQAEILSVDHSSESGLSDDRVMTFILDRIAGLLSGFPGYVFIRRAALSLDPWTVENGEITPTLKLKRSVLTAKFKSEIDAMYRR